MAYRVILALLLGWFSSCAMADEVEKNRGTLVGFDNGSSVFGRGLMFNYNVSFRMWPMFNEPVYNVIFTWSFDERARITPQTTLMYLSQLEDRPVDRLISDLEPKLQDSIKPYEVKVRIEGHKRSDPNAHYFVIWDVGVPGSSGSKSYNTPASVSWEDMYQHALHRVTVEEAKALMKDGFIADSVSIAEIKWHLADYEREMDARYPPGKKAALRRAAEKHINLLAQLQGLPKGQLDQRLQSVLSELETKRHDGDPNFMQGLERMIAKFEAGLPPEMRNMNVEARYQEALQEIKAEKEEDLNQPQKLTFNFAPTYADWVKDKRAEIAARKQFTAPMVAFTDPESQRCGFKDEMDNVLVQAQYDTCYGFKMGHGIVQKYRNHHGSWGVVNNNGEEVIPIQYERVSIEAGTEDDPVYVVVISSHLQGGCGDQRKITEYQRMDSSGQAIGSSYLEDVSFPTICLMLHSS